MFSCTKWKKQPWFQVEIPFHLCISPHFWSIASRSVAAGAPQILQSISGAEPIIWCNPVLGAGSTPASQAYLVIIWPTDLPQTSIDDTNTEIDDNPMNFLRPKRGSNTEDPRLANSNLYIKQEQNLWRSLEYPREITNEVNEAITSG